MRYRAAPFSFHRNAMKKCPTCYAIMRESVTPTQIPELQHKPVDGTPEVSAARLGTTLSTLRLAPVP